MRKASCRKQASEVSLEECRGFETQRGQAYKHPSQRMGAGNYRHSYICGRPLVWSGEAQEDRGPEKEQAISIRSDDQRMSKELSTL